MQIQQNTMYSCIPVSEHTVGSKTLRQALIYLILSRKLGNNEKVWLIAAFEAGKETPELNWFWPRGGSVRLLSSETCCTPLVLHLCGEGFIERTARRPRKTEESRTSRSHRPVSQALCDITRSWACWDNMSQQWVQKYRVVLKTLHITFRAVSQYFDWWSLTFGPALCRLERLKREVLAFCSFLTLLVLWSG